VSRLALALPAALPLAAQTLTLRSEFLRVDPRGEILAQDATPLPREILSPAVVRNAFASFHVVIESERGNYFLFAGSNPDNIFRVAVYQENFARRGEDWIPDALEPVKLPAFGVIPDPQAAITGQTARAYLVDVWVPPDAPVGRTRLEIQMKAGGWTIWPMEVRILPARVPALRYRSSAPLPDPALRADESATAPLVDYLGQHGEGPEARRGLSRPPADAPRSLREVIRRNAEQDMALARRLDPKALVPELKGKVAAGGSAEWYLGVRDLIYRLSAAAFRE
jgi:hypothetical protein